MTFREGTLQHWANEYILGTSVAAKLAPPSIPRTLDDAQQSVTLLSPGRPDTLVRGQHAPKTPRRDALKSPEKRAQIVHTFLHHELQAAELMAWAILRFPHMPPAFLRGLAQIAEDEIRHMNLYQNYLNALGFEFGSFPIRDWFWERIPACQTPEAFVATIGIGFEGGNLDHAARFANSFRQVDDEAGAAIQDQICEEEIPHVRFAMHWFERLRAKPSFELWRATLPAPLSPMVMRGKPLNQKARERAGFDADFLHELSHWQPEP